MAVGAPLSDLSATQLALRRLEDEEMVLRQKLAALRNIKSEETPSERKIRESRQDGDLKDSGVAQASSETIVSDRQENYMLEEADDLAVMLEEYCAPAPKETPHLPTEILLQILEYVSNTPTAQRTLASCAELSRQWHNAAVPFLYAHPHLYGKNFDPFARAICPSINLHVRKSPLAELVRVLDMGKLVHQGSRSTTARLLGRVKGNVEMFVAPKASFGINVLPALSKCQKLRLLDLSLVSESPPLPDLFKAVASLETLRTFRLPRSTGFGVHHKPASFTWPPNLTELVLSGGIDAHFLHGVVAFPPTLRSLTIEHCPLAKSYAVIHLLRTAVRPLEQLQSLTVAHMQRLNGHALDDVLFLLPQISKLSVSVDYITPSIFDEGHFSHFKEPLITTSSTSGGSLSNEKLSTSLQHTNLRTLELTNSDTRASDDEDKLTPFDVLAAIDEGTLPKLRQVRVAQSLRWNDSLMADDTELLTDALQEGSRRDWEAREWIFAEMGEAEYARGWERVSGVWVVEG